MDVNTENQVGGRFKGGAGKVEAIARIVEDDRYCVDVLLPIAASLGAVGQIRRVVLQQDAETRVAVAMASGNASERYQKIDELTDLFSRYGSLRER